MKYIDFFGQTILFAGAVIFGVIAGVSGVFFAMSFIGGWQMVSSFVSIVLRAPFHKQKQIHFFTAVIYLVSLYFGWLLQVEMAWLTNVLVALPPLSLGIYYYVITWRWYNLNVKRGKFLPHISF